MIILTINLNCLCYFYHCPRPRLFIFFAMATPINKLELCTDDPLLAKGLFPPTNKSSSIWWGQTSCLGFLNQLNAAKKWQNRQIKKKHYVAGNFFALLPTAAPTGPLQETDPGDRFQLQTDASFRFLDLCRGSNQQHDCRNGKNFISKFS